MKVKPIDVFVIDYPWQYWTYSENGRERSPDKHYGVMGLEHYTRLQSELLTIASKRAVFLHWVTNPLKVEFAVLCKQWESELGVSYRSTAFTWAKLPRSYDPKQMTLFAPDVTDPDFFFMGMGYYTRQNTEEVWLLRRNDFEELPRLNKGVRQLIVAPIGEHSEKPHELFRRVDSLYGTMVSKVEIFARRERPDWLCWGNEIDGQDIFSTIATYRQRLEEQRSE